MSGCLIESDFLHERNRDRAVELVDLLVEELADGERNLLVRTELEDDPLLLLGVGAQEQQRHAVELDQRQRPAIRTPALKAGRYLDLLQVDRDLGRDRGTLLDGRLVREDLALEQEALDERLHAFATVLGARSS